MDIVGKALREVCIWCEKWLKENNTQLHKKWMDERPFFKFPGEGGGVLLPNDPVGGLQVQ
jgi:hypothetical protein